MLYASFIVRLWREPVSADVTEHGAVQMGELESIQTSRAWQSRGCSGCCRCSPGHLATSKLAGRSRKKFDFFLTPRPAIVGGMLSTWETYEVLIDMGDLLA